MNPFALIAQLVERLFSKQEVSGSSPDLGSISRPSPTTAMIAICVGHSRYGDNGAVSVGGVTEHAFNSGVAKELRLMLAERQIDSVVIDDYEGRNYSEAISWVAGRVKSLGATLAIELHFNSATASAHGYEFLCWGTSVKGRKLALAFADAYRDLFPQATARRDRGTYPVSSSARGAQFLRKTHCPALICEPFFGSNQHEWTIARNDPARIAEAYADAIENFLKA